MASQPKPAQKSSKWGSFLTGLESKLDTILADEDTAKAAAQKRKDSGLQEPLGKRAASPGPQPARESLSRAPSVNRAQDRLNERLAKVVGNRASVKSENGSTSVSGIPSRTASPANLTSSPRASSDIQGDAKGGSEMDSTEINTYGGNTSMDLASTEEGATDEASKETVAAQGSSIQSPMIAVEEVQEEKNALRLSTDSRGSLSADRSLDLARDTTPGALETSDVNGTAAETETIPSEDFEKTINQMKADHEAAELRRQEETHTFLEQIDAMQAKLQYLTKEAAEVAKNAKAESVLGSPEHRLASKDERIALLIEEGQKLSQTELKHMSIIKRLRVKTGEDEKVIMDAKRNMEKQEKAFTDARERAQRAEVAQKRAVEKTKTLPKIEKELEFARADREAKDVLIQDLQKQLSQATSAAKEAEVMAKAEALEQEQRQVQVLTDDLSSVRAEKEMIEKQLQTELRELREKIEREQERARAAEIERQGEQSILESRLEAYRARAEEASVGQGGDVQTKLLRQIETLQNQYAIASENWQGIEGSLLSRVTTLEKDRDDIAKREADIRKKARESHTRSRGIEEEFDRCKAKTQDMDDHLSSRKRQLEALQEKLDKSESEVKAARDDLKAEREAWDIRLAQRLEDERNRTREETARSTPDIYQQFRTESPITHGRTRKSSNGERNNPHGRRIQGLAITGTGHASVERPLSRRSSHQPLYTLQTSESQQQRPVSRHDSTSTFPQVSVTNGIPETPSMTGRDDDFFSGFHTPATPDRTINDVISASTAGAGPSVQLVERMSAAVRRLESEKAEHRDELSRLSSQRDEAREQVVNLMREVEEKRGWESRVKEMEGNLQAVEERYLATLELLGEKSEKVDELKADVQDLKGMYRELVENTMK